MKKHSNDWTFRLLFRIGIVVAILALLSILFTSCEAQIPNLYSRPVKRVINLVDKPWEPVIITAPTHEYNVGDTVSCVFIMGDTSKHSPKDQFMYYGFRVISKVDYVFLWHSKKRIGKRWVVWVCRDDD